MGAFREDPIMEAAVRTLIADRGIRTVVETGTYIGETTESLAKMCGEVHTIESNEKYYGLARERLCGIVGVTQHKRKSIAILAALGLCIRKPALYFLDAHWPDTPVLDEIVIIAASDPAPVIIIHDCQVPGRPELKFDTYNGQPICFDWLKPALDNIRRPWRHWFNSEAGGQKVGALFVVPE